MAGLSYGAVNFGQRTRRLYVMNKKDNLLATVTFWGGESQNETSEDLLFPG
jgi:hypothetical protein